MEVRSANQSARQASASVLPTKDLTRLSGLAGKLINQRTIRFDNIAGASSLTMLGTWPVLLEVQSSSSSAPTPAAALLIRVVSTAAWSRAVHSTVKRAAGHPKLDAQIIVKMLSKVALIPNT